MGAGFKGHKTPAAEERSEKGGGGVQTRPHMPQNLKSLRLSGRDSPCTTRARERRCSRSVAWG